MRYSLLEFGGMRSFNKVMNNNLTLLENNLIEIKKFLNIGNNDIIDIYILTDKTDINEHSILLCEISSISSFSKFSNPFISDILFW